MPQPQPQPETKADKLRALAREFPGLTAGELIDLAKDRFKDMKVHTSEASKYLKEVSVAAVSSTASPKPSPPARAEASTAMEFSEEAVIKASKGPQAVRTTPPGGARTISEKLAFLKEAAEEVGGVEEAKKLLDLIG